MDEIIRAVRDCPSGALSYAIDGVEARAQVDWDDGARARDRGLEGRSVPDHRRDPAHRPPRRARQARRRAPRSSTTRCAAAGTPRTSRSAAACTGTSSSRTRSWTPTASPTLFEWCGGLPALTRMTRIFYEKHVPEDPLLAPLFASMSPDHPGARGEVARRGVRRAEALQRDLRRLQPDDLPAPRQGADARSSARAGSS